LEVKSITIDNGLEFQKIGILAGWLKCKIYYCEPYASYQRGSNENFNGLVRRMWKKQTDFTLIPDETIKFIQDKINNMPRKILNWKSSYQEFQTR
jgi:IS30 family transposase